MDRSTHNSRIERIWVEVGSQFAHCEVFRFKWNSHPLFGEGHDQSPDDMRLMGQLEHGLYIDDCDHIHPDVINQYHIHEQAAADEQGWEDEEIAAHLEQNQESNFHHAAVRVPRHIDPFKDAPDSFSVFEETLQHVRNEGHMPIGYGLHPDEWETDEYPSFEHI
ncbi:hypothetical protein PAXINDRAFT_157792 [Paxillus involutus ATCC 200175]|uniref:Uncharacterized protein n=1 Tax=Paxillus involutus ATCC 200175 TaxID=664439 RepID=A0A0C9T2G6_PAXIN|nr:hypothetical protein PAXINDRAFT_157792 [Paxillus involutus ATCC 200175]